MTYPNELLYTKSHEWLKEADGIAEVGISEFAQDALGDVAARTGETLFSGEGGGDLKTRFGQQLAEKIRADVKALRGADGDLVLIGLNGKLRSCNRRRAAGNAAGHRDELRKRALLRRSGFDAA